MEIVLDHWEQQLVYHALLRMYRQEIDEHPEYIDLIMDLKKLIRKFGPDPDEVFESEDENDARAEEAYSLFYADRKEEEDSPPYVEPGTTIEEVE